jgi:hypothetical protein
MKCLIRRIPPFLSFCIPLLVCRPQYSRHLTDDCLPTHSHLLEKIRSMGERSQKKEQGQIDGVSVPRPIKRRLIV